MSTLKMHPTCTPKREKDTRECVWDPPQVCGAHFHCVFLSLRSISGVHFELQPQHYPFHQIEVWILIGTPNSLPVSTSHGTGKTAFTHSVLNPDCFQPWETQSQRHFLGQCTAQCITIRRKRPHFSSLYCKVRQPSSDVCHIIMKQAIKIFRVNYITLPSGL